jgi:hypothetical protein
MRNMGGLEGRPPKPPTLGGAPAKPGRPSTSWQTRFLRELPASGARIRPCGIVVGETVEGNPRYVSPPSTESTWPVM